MRKELIDNLILDSENPRLPRAVRGSEEPELIKYLADHSAVHELMSAIGANNFFEAESLIVIPSTEETGKYVVVEGNRRLCALKLLSNPNLYPQSRKIQLAAQEAIYKPLEVPISIYNERKDVLEYLGYRHITGVRSWGPLAKARYAYDLFLACDDGLNEDEKYKVVARQIGSKSSHIKKLVLSLKVFEIIEDKEYFDIEDLDDSTFDFSLLSTALGYQAIQEFLEISNDSFEEITALSEKETLEEFVRWCFEKKQEPNKPESTPKSKLGESRNLSKLANIVSEPDALSEFRSGATLTIAYQKTRGASADLLENLHEIRRLLQECNSVVAEVTITDEIETQVSNSFKQIKILRSIVESDI